MVNKYSTLTLVQLREIVKAQGIKNTSIMRKAELVQILCDLEEKANAAKAEDKTTGEAVPEDKTLENRSVRSAEERTRSDNGRQEQNWERRPRAERYSDGRNNGYRSSDSRNSGQRSMRRRYDESRAEMGEDILRSADLRFADGQAAESRSVESRFAETKIAEEKLPEERILEEVTEEDRQAENSEGRDDKSQNIEDLDSGKMADGILEVMPDGFGFIRCANYLPGNNDIYVSPAQIRRFNLKTGDIIEGNIKVKAPTEKFSALLYVNKVNGFSPAEAAKRTNFEDMTPIFPNSRIRLENPRATVPMRIVDLVSPIGKGQRGMIVSPPKTGKTTLLKQIAKSINYNHPDMNMIILLIDERPEEVTDIKEYIEGENVEVIYSTFDELPEHHKRVSEMVLERAKRLVEHKKDVVILLDSITRLARAYNLTVPPSGRTLSGGLDPAALHMPKKFFGAARCMREGGSLTVLATALVETGSKMDDVVFEEFKGTGNMELVLDRKLSEKRIFPAIDIPRSGTRREELLLEREEMDAMYMMRKALNGMKSDEALEHILDMFMRTRNNRDFIANIKRTKII